MEVIIRKTFLKQLKTKPKHVWKETDEMVTALERAVSLESSGLDYKLMEGQKKGENYYRIRLGEWRVGIEYKNPSTILICIMSRGDIYKHFPPGKKK